MKYLRFQRVLRNLKKFKWDQKGLELVLGYKKVQKIIWKIKKSFNCPELDKKIQFLNKKIKLNS